MNNSYENSVYMGMMQNSLQRKKTILETILENTKEQENLLKKEPFEEQHFMAILDEKGNAIDELNQMDEGFDALFRKVEKDILTQPELFKEQIQSMQVLIREISGLAAQIQALEHQNSDRMEIYLSCQKKKIRDYHVSHRTATNYYRNMSNVHRQDQSYFFNEKK